MWSGTHCLGASFRAPIGQVRKFLSILLLFLLGLPAVSPLMALGQDGDGGLPACCRRNGKHHCMLSAAERSWRAAQESGTAQWQAPLEKCPYCPSFLTTSRPNLLAPPTAQSVFAQLLSHPAVVVQVRCRARIALDRARQKRGPPTLA